ncbi:MAG TPA: hypothetical protein VIW68_09145 [Candidatus Sulfotelmatobacter sp.]
MSVLLMIAVPTVAAQAVSCKASGDMDEATHAAIISAGQRYFDMAAHGDLANLRQNAAPRAISDFADIEAAVNNDRSEIAGSRGTARPPFLLEAQGTAPIAHAEFFCGVFNRRGQTADSAVFKFENFAPGKYGAVIFDAGSATSPSTVSFLLQQQASDWKLSGLYIAPAQAAGHAADWYVSRARDYKGKHDFHNAWLYYLQARILKSPLPFMSTADTDKLYDESQSLQPSDFPVGAETAELAAGAETYRLSAVFPQAVGGDLDLIVKYQSSDVSDTAEAYHSNVTVIKAMLAKFPELRDAFSAVVARAVEPSGRDYGTLMKMRDIK